MKRTLLLMSLCAVFATANAQNGPGSTVGDTGTVTFTYMGNPVTYTTVRAADGMVWLQQNLGATQVGTSSTDAAAYGHYFQWGRWDDGHQLTTSTTANVSTITPNNPSGIPTGNVNFLIGPNPNDWWGGGTGTDTWTNAAPSTTNGTNPCAAIGPDWYMPTITEFSGLVAAENITNEATAFSSNLKLVMAGQRDGGNGMMVNLGAAGQYVSSSANGPYADIISIMPSGINNPDQALRGYGLSVRCMSACDAVTPPGTVNGDDTVCVGSTQTYYINAIANADAYTWTVPNGWTVVGPVDDTTITVVVGSTGGNVTVIASNACNFESEILDVVVNPLPVASITGSDNTLSTGTYTSYQWLVNDTIIAGATTNPYTATESGPYSVIVTDANGCSDTSTIYTHTLRVNNVNGAAAIKMYPNPAVDVLHIDAPMSVNAAIYSIDGRLVMSATNATQVDISALPSGTYHVKLTDKDGMTMSMQKLTVLRQ